MPPERGAFFKREFIMLTWKIYKSGYKWVVEWSDGIKTVFMSEKSALQAVNNRFFDTYF